MFAQSITHFIPLVYEHRFWGYVVLFLGMVLEGEIFLVVSAMLARAHAFDFGEVLWVSFAGIMVGDVFWYGVGIVLSRYHGRFSLAKTAEKTVLMFFPNFNRKPFFSIFFSKFIYGVNHAALVFSGIVRLKFSLFMKAEFIASFFWVAIYAVAGYMFGEAALAVTHEVSRLALLAVVFVVGFVLLERWIGKYVEQQEIKKYKDEDSNS
jgi:membrane protein DedA with SNARE-associated domain